MRVKAYTVTVVAIVALAVAYFTAEAMANRGDGDLGYVYVTSQGLWYETFVPVSPLPFQGPFQKLENGTTEFGPGDPGYLGGRWWIDRNGNDVMDPPGKDSDAYLLCPLLPPGYEENPDPES